MNTAEECYLRGYTLYGVYNRDDSAQRDPMEEAAARWEAENGR